MATPITGLESAEQLFKHKNETGPRDSSHGGRFPPESLYFAAVSGFLEEWWETICHSPPIFSYTKL
jgi:hypothetical protein